jgi:hypothetical protein
MLYAVRMFVPDPFIYLRIRGREMVVMSDLEIDRARRQAAHCRAIPLSLCQQKLRREGKKSRSRSIAEVIRLVLDECKTRKVVVPGNFPCLATNRTWHQGEGGRETSFPKAPANLRLNQKNQRGAHDGRGGAGGGHSGAQIRQDRQGSEAHLSQRPVDLGKTALHH